MQSKSVECTHFQNIPQKGRLNPAGKQPYESGLSFVLVARKEGHPSIHAGLIIYAHPGQWYVTPYWAYFRTELCFKLTVSPNLF